MTVSADLRVLFRAPAGPRRGFGHLVRCRSLARALGVRPVLAVRGGPRARAAARALGCDVVSGTAADVLRRMAPEIVVVDDPIAAAARRWIACARRAGCRVVTVHDLGLGAPEGDLIVDGSVVRAVARLANDARLLRGPRFAILDPAFAATAIRPVRAGAPRVCIALGGGPRVQLAEAIARAIEREVPWARIRVAGGFAVATAGGRGRITWTGPLDSLVHELAACDVAVVGGVSLYEACAVGVPAVAVPVVAPQRPTVRGFLNRRAARGVAATPCAEDIAREVVQLLTRPAARQTLAARGRQVIDGQGAWRVAEAMRGLVRPRNAMTTAPRRERRAS
jgi:UDP-2,4-diacetamido-2,4,6-trideoxy-beta-L-altropyranose hydrolase